ncbi:hypothetical protein N7468_007480 [Penicillium chermesinum]|uniref:Hydrophobin n=1 Tax=Penicillium chermesinum TaxID=63820 RepID=A0A9W9NUE6_9EURO|nr:uncharacterized protein N7468_007480 [Penicillium chermesinum]KAJ5226255.1 hypothetical protein N7468_007480 [Penicillium chermesinum]KAJ6160564.1 hypothetical protein N7470_003960 [Penicillium chermesinum]
MRVSVLVTLASALALGSAKKINMSCSFAADHSGMIQQPYCCRDLVPAQNNGKANEATDCVLLKEPQMCEDESRPACCYDIGPKKICTSHVVFQDASDV